jgi:hypothetical protein
MFFRKIHLGNGPEDLILMGRRSKKAWRYSWLCQYFTI